MRAHRRREIWKSRGTMSGLLRDSFGTLSSVSAGLMISKLVTFSRYWHDFLFFFNTTSRSRPKKIHYRVIYLWKSCLLLCWNICIFVFIFSSCVYSIWLYIIKLSFFIHPKIFFCPIFCSDFESTGYTRPIPVSKYFDNVTHAQICNHLEVEMNMAAASWMNFERLLVILSPISSRCVGHKYVP